MKYLKTFETQQDLPEVGNYFYVNNFGNSGFSDEYVNFLKNHIGYIERVYNGVNYIWIDAHIIFNRDDSEEIYNSFNYTQSFKLTSIITSPNIEDLKIIRNTNKFNL